MWFWRRKALKSGNCECGHFRCVHKNGSGACNAGISHDGGITFNFGCACEVYIRDDDDDDGSDDEPEVPTDPEVSELKRIAGLK